MKMKKRLTTIKAVDIAIEHWTWLSTSGSKHKRKWPKYEEYATVYGYNNRLYSYCALCEAQKTGAWVGAPCSECMDCPVFVLDVQCNSVFGTYPYWVNAKTRTARRKAARAAVKVLKECRVFVLENPEMYKLEDEV